MVIFLNYLERGFKKLKSALYFVSKQLYLVYSASISRDAEIFLFLLWERERENTKPTITGLKISKMTIYPCLLDYKDI